MIERFVYVAIGLCALATFLLAAIWVLSFAALFMLTVAIPYFTCRPVYPTRRAEALN